MTQDVLSQDSLRWLRDATGMVLVGDAFAGTAYLLGREHAGTCAHVIKRAGVDGRLNVRFPWGRVGASVTATDAAADVAILALDTAAPVDALPWDAEAPIENDAAWIAYGYPAMTAPAAGEEPVAMLVQGTVRDAHATDDWNAAALQLFCEDFAAGKGAMPHGMSGSPVLVRDRLVGHLKRILTASEDTGAASLRAELGAAYACPVTSVIPLLPETHRSSQPSWGEPLLPPGSSYAPSFYVPRDSDRRAWRYAEVNAPIWILSGWRMGASWFLTHLLHRMTNAAKLNGRTFRCIPVDLHELGLGSDSTGDDFATRTAFAIAHHTGANPDRIRPPGQLLWTLRLTYWIEEEILPRAGDGMVLAFDHFDALTGHPIEADVCRMLRRWVDQRSLLPPWSRLQPILISNLSPATTTAGSSVYVSPVATPPIQLEDFTSAECELLARAYGLHWAAADIEAELRPWIGGNPYLFVAAAHHAAAGGVRLAQVRARAESGEEPFADALAWWFGGIRKYEAGMDALRRLIELPGAPIDPDVATRLCSIGVLAERGRGTYRFQYKAQENHLCRRFALP